MMKNGQLLSCWLNLRVGFSKWNLRDAGGFDKESVSDKLRMRTGWVLTQPTWKIPDNVLAVVQNAERSCLPLMRRWLFIKPTRRSLESSTLTTAMRCALKSHPWNPYHTLVFIQHSIVQGEKETCFILVIQHSADIFNILCFYIFKRWHGKEHVFISVVKRKDTCKVR